MRISDWSSDVCSSDLDAERGRALEAALRKDGGQAHFVDFDAADLKSIDNLVARSIEILGHVDCLANNAGVSKRIGLLDITEADWDRSEAHPSELQSLMRISYAVFCLTKDNIMSPPGLQRPSA